MDDSTTLRARALLEPVPANALIGLRVVSSTPAGGTVRLPADDRLSNPLGAVQAGPLCGLLDAAGLAAVLGHCADDAELDGLVVVARRAELTFTAPGRGELTGGAAVDAADVAALRAVLDGSASRTDLTTPCTAHDRDGSLVARAGFGWALRRPDTVR